MQDGVCTELWEQCTGRANGHQVRPGRINTLQRLCIGGLYRGERKDGHTCLSEVYSLIRARAVARHARCADVTVILWPIIPTRAIIGGAVIRCFLPVRKLLFSTWKQ